MSKFSGNRISQETFDEVVAENVEEFEMTLQEAIQDAMVQFQKQGVDLSNIDLTGGEGREEMLNALQALHDLSTPVKDVHEAVVIISTLTNLCERSHQFSRRNMNLMNDKGGLNDLLLHLEPVEDKQVVLSVAKLVHDLSIQSEDLRDFFEPGGSDKLCRLLKSFVAVTSEDVSAQIEALLVLGRTVSRSENNKVALMKAGIGEIIADLLNNNNFSTVQDKSCILIRGLCIHDDLRREMSCAFDNGKFFLKHPTVVPALIKLAARYQGENQTEEEKQVNINLSSSSLGAAKALVTTNEAVQILSVHGINELICKVIRQAAQGTTSEQLPVVLMRSVVGLLRNIVADDGRKDQLISQGILDLLIHILNTEPYSQDGQVMEHGFGCLAQFSLRSPGNSQRIVDSNVAIDLIVKSMRKFFDRDGLQRQACLTIRNIAGRCPELRGMLLDSGIESVLRDAGRITTCVDEAYSALRDLGVDVQYVKVTETGAVMPAYEQFGSTALNFRPIYDEADTISTRINEEARAPFAAPIINHSSAHYGHDHIHDHDDDDCDGCCH